MGIRFACHACGKRLNIKTELAGRRGVCPACSQRFRIPQQDAPTSRPIDRRGGRERPRQQPEALPLAASQSGTPAASNTVPSSPGGSAFWGNEQATWYVRPSTGGQFGPADGPTMQQWFAEGRVADDTLLWRDGWTDWRIADSLGVPAAGSSCSPGSAEPPSEASPVETAASAPAAAVVPMDSKADRRKTIRSGRGRLINFTLMLIAAAALGTLTFVLISG